MQLFFIRIKYVCLKSSTVIGLFIILIPYTFCLKGELFATKSTILLDMSFYEI